ncbi:macrophage mannose receptor 1-like [Ostrinia furnacalis]|uniref:macrophage mannose receptor 1-like n=1 Tax=Ostrinia furnacalis TaxID=93504 RepID=UPI00103A311A|nr:macrophage mannose receptor 1-like [Ostrinia furnacalis]
MQTVVRIFLFACFCIAVIVGSSRQFRCDYKYIPEAGGWLKFNEMPSNFNEARLRCHMEGAVLASPLTPALRDAMANLAKNNGNTCGIFTGIHAVFSRGDFASIEGVPLSKIPHSWAKDEPDNFKDEENCIIQLPEGVLADVRCKDTFPYMCYKKKATLVMTACGTIDPEYNLDSRTNKCYKFHRVPRTWSRAYMTCMAEGGHLAIINSDTEATVIRELFAKNPGGVMLGSFWKDVAFMGFHDWTEHGDWRTIQGQTLKEAGYDKFSPGEPNNATTGEFCGAVYRSAMFDDLWCENQYAFICEKSPDSLMCDDEH